MKFTQDLLTSLQESGENICAHSNDILVLLKDYHFDYFNDFSRRLYYFWRNSRRPVPLCIIIKIMADKKINEIDINAFSVKGGNKIHPPNENDIQFYYLLGLILGDGCLVKQCRDSRCTYRLQITFRYKNEADKIRAQIKRLFGISASIYKGHGKCYDLCAYSKPLVMILNKKYQIPLGLKYSSLCVPKIIFFSSRDKKIAFLKGVFDSDGNVYNYKNRKSVQLRQKSKNFIGELKQLFDDVGIRFNNPYSDKANGSWVLWSSKVDLVDTFINEIIDFNLCAPVAQPG
jgi:intein/homing endonuclease